jgi:hypothetical protein
VINNYALMHVNNQLDIILMHALKKKNQMQIVHNSILFGERCKGLNINEN